MGVTSKIRKTTGLLGAKPYQATDRERRFVPRGVTNIPF